MWFAAASMLVTILHEVAHAVTAYLLGVPSTLFNYSAELDMTIAQARSSASSIIRLAGPAACLVAGIASYAALRRFRNAAAAIPLLFLTVFGLGTFFGNMMSASFVGDFSTVAEALHWTRPMRISVSVAGALAVAVVHFWAGRVLGQFRLVAVSAALGMLIVMLANWPMPAPSVTARLAEASFWLFAVAGAVTARRGTAIDVAGRPHWIDAAVLVAAIVIVRVMKSGIAFTP
jgi:hypothetical protein